MKRVRKISLSCKICSKEFEEYISHLRFGQGKFCSIACRSRARALGMMGRDNPRWNEKPSYRAIHKWVQLKLGKASKCLNCRVVGLSRYHWANRSKQYSRDLSDWIELCPKCNKASDTGRLVL